MIKKSKFYKNWLITGLFFTYISLSVSTFIYRTGDVSFFTVVYDFVTSYCVAFLVVSALDKEK
jgi:hypothetical protein